uniref:Ig-like domain-containing protein n=1 Tax=Papio anubis TaxID=9555 RepID=A0A8I5N102_PAPAN
MHSSFIYVFVAAAGLGEQRRECGAASSYRSGIAQKITQTQPAMFVQEKEAVTLDCTYDTSDQNYGLFWYKQPSSGEMIFLILQMSYDKQNATEGHYSLNFQKARKSVNLVISASQVGDSATYFCAMRRHSERTVGGRCTKAPRTCLRPPSAGEPRREINITDRKWLQLWQHRGSVVGNTLTLRKHLFKFTDHDQNYH